jgi:hypothetical protein
MRRYREKQMRSGTNKPGNMEEQDTCMLQSLAKYAQPLSEQNKSILAQSLTKINDFTVKPTNHDL